MKDKQETVKCPMMDKNINYAQCAMTSKKEIDFWGPGAAMFNKGCPCNKREQVLMAKRNCEDCGRIIYQGRVCANCAKARKEATEEMERKEIVKEAKAAKEVDAGSKEQPPPAIGPPPVTTGIDGTMRDEKTGKPMRVCRECGQLKICHAHGLCSSCWWALIKKPQKAAERESRRKMAKEWAAEKANGAKVKEVYVDPPVPEVNPVHDDIVELPQAAADKAPVNFNPPAPHVSIVLGFYDNIDLDILDFIDREAKRCRRTADQQILWMLQSHLTEMRGEAAA